MGRSMAIADMILSEFEEEIAATRRVLQRVPHDRLSFTPHERSMSLGELASHDSVEEILALFNCT